MIEIHFNVVVVKKILSEISQTKPPNINSFLKVEALWWRSFTKNMNRQEYFSNKDQK